jgi:hypothetical protein
MLLNLTLVMALSVAFFELVSEGDAFSESLVVLLFKESLGSLNARGWLSGFGSVGISV